MKKLFFILKNGLNNPRFYIESINVKWKQIIVLPLIVTILIAVNFGLALFPTLRSIQTDINESINYLPDFQIENGELKLKEDQKALYFESRQFQLIIDDQLTNLSKDEGLILKSENKRNPELTSIFNLLLVKNQIVVYTPENGQVFAFNHDMVTSKESLVTVLTYASQFNFIQIVSLIIMTWIAAVFAHFYFIVITSLLTGILNIRLNFPLPFIVRMKLVMVCSVVPILMIELIKLVWSNFYVPFYLLVGLTLFIIYHSFKQHTLFMHQLLSHMDINIIKKEDIKSDEDKKDS
ncbi:DUF1189 domain-containing protein [Facklamia sp. 7083-14-GEN3]|uniref:DUF1189 domain-containing protein n=1 Tax=Facklamia sp. 7083-14-GEN3 TaxID=2973478 RepID=UPI00215D294C|nr:DUF1189 domain-containing protein [Facklamia sp. 7083-14-GEN3]MCR8968729.1 DUF1189 domain-containing protein [Facklamia sp. 7083-14-GEN3]